jgi:hypothetical protein
MRQTLPSLTRPPSPTRPFRHGVSGRSWEVSTTVSRCRWVLVYAALLATIVACGLLRPPAAGAEPFVCNPEFRIVHFSLPGHNTAEFTKKADGCAQPWLSYIERTAHIRMWVFWKGSYHDIQETRCEKGEHTCNLASNWGSACNGNGTSCNEDPFHLQWVEGEAPEMEAELHY